MTTRRQWRGNLSAMRAEKRQAVDQYPARRFPIQHEIQKLEDELNAFNERIEELENEGHRSHAMEVLKANAIDFARQIDELRCLLVEPAPKDAPKSRVKRPFQKLSHRRTRRIANKMRCARSPGSQKRNRNGWLDAHGPRTICAY